MKYEAFMQNQVDDEDLSDRSTRSSESAIDHIKETNVAFIEKDINYPLISEYKK